MVDDDTFIRASVDTFSKITLSKYSQKKTSSFLLRTRVLCVKFLLIFISFSGFSVGINFSNWFSIFYGISNLLSYSFRIFFSLKLHASLLPPPSLKSAHRADPSSRHSREREKILILFFYYRILIFGGNIFVMCCPFFEIISLHFIIFLKISSSHFPAVYIYEVIWWGSGGWKYFYFFLPFLFHTFWLYFIILNISLKIIFTHSAGCLDLNCFGINFHFCLISSYG